MTYALLRTLHPFIQRESYSHPSSGSNQSHKDIDLMCQHILRQIFREIKISIPGNPYQRFYQLRFKCIKTSPSHSENTPLDLFLRHKRAVKYSRPPSSFTLPSLKKSALLAQNYRENLFFEYRKKAINLLGDLSIEKEFYEQIVHRFYTQGITLEIFVEELIDLLTFLENHPTYQQRENDDWNDQPHPAPRLFFLMKALQQNDWIVIPALIHSGLDPNQLLDDPYQESYFDRIFIPLLHVALRKNHVLASAALIQAGADVNQESLYEKTSVHSLEIAAEHVNPELLQLLIQQGADVKKFGQKALQILREKEKRIFSQYGLHLCQSSLDSLALLQICQKILERS